MEYVKCNLCGRNDTKVRYVFLNDRFGKWKKRNEASLKFMSLLKDKNPNIPKFFYFVQCDGCGLIYQNPRFDFNELRMIAYPPEMFIKGKERKIIRGTKVRERYKWLREIKQIEKFSNKGKILDIGCANGIFLYYCEKNGWEPYGIEQSEIAVNYATKELDLNVKQGTLEDVKYPDDFFDVVTMFDVIEHLPDPKKTLQKIHKILKPNGLLIVMTINVGSLNARVAGKYWTHIHPLGHYYYFSRKTLSKVLEITGFKPFKVEYHVKGYRDMLSFAKRTFFDLIYFSFIFREKLPFVWHELGDRMVFYAKNIEDKAK